MTLLVYVLFVLVVIIFVPCQCGSFVWLPVNNSANTPAAYSVIEFPQTHHVILGALQPAAIFTERYFAPITNLCTTWRNAIPNAANFSCFDTFCPNTTTTNATSLSISNMTIFAAMHNWCYYCSNATAIANFTAFHNLLAQRKCHLFSGKYLNHSCLDDAARPILFEFKNETFPLCYCTKWSKYGYQCDAYTNGLVDFYYLGKNWVQMAAVFPILLLFIIVLLIPECGTRTVKCHRKWKHLQKFQCFYLSYICSLRSVIIYLIVTSLMMLVLEQVVGLIWITHAGRALELISVCNTRIFLIQ